MKNKAIPTIIIFLTLVFSSCKKATSASLEKGVLSEMVFSAKTFDFGNVNQGDIVSTQFEFTNSGKADLIITEALGSCGCTVPDYPKDVIEPGEIGKIKVSFNSTAKSGLQNKTVTLTVNTKTGTEVLNIKANVIPRTGIAQ
jgi:hypothetical protein